MKLRKPQYEATDREFLEYLDNQLSGLIRQACYLRQQVQSQLGWIKLKDAEETDETP